MSLCLPGLGAAVGTLNHLMHRHDNPVGAAAGLAVGLTAWAVLYPPLWLHALSTVVELIGRCLSGLTTAPVVVLGMLLRVVTFGLWKVR